MELRPAAAHLNPSSSVQYCASPAGWASFQSAFGSALCPDIDDSVLEGENKRGALQVMSSVAAAASVAQIYPHCIAAKVQSQCLEINAVWRATSDAQSTMTTLYIERRIC